MRILFCFVAFVAISLSVSSNRVSAQTIRLLANRTLSIAGTPNADTVTVTRTGASLIVVSGETPRTFPIASVARISAKLGGGDDSFDASGIALPCTVLGEGGNDKIQGGRANDNLDGGNGRDAILGGPGADVVIGGGGEDLVVGGSLFSSDALNGVSGIMDLWLTPFDDAAARRAAIANLGTSVINDDRIDTLSGALGTGLTKLAGVISGDQENPPVETPAAGTVDVVYNPVTKKFSIDVTVTDLDPALITGYHIHRAAAGANGPVIIDFTDLFELSALQPEGTGFTFFQSAVDLPAAEEAAFLSGQTYINFHTATNPRGIIRGQLLDTTTDLFLGEATDVKKDFTFGVDFDTLFDLTAN